LSDKIGYHISQLRNWELGINSPNLRQLTDWCTVFGAEIGIVDKRVELRVVEDTPLAQPDRARLMAGR
jgi:hypothetical protein